jgi:very-short-patch-repair endonuclease
MHRICEELIFRFCAFVPPGFVHVQMDRSMSDLLASKRLDPALAAVAAKQHGTFSFAQVVEAGGDASTVNHRIRAGRWLRLSPRAYAFAGTPVSFHSKVMAACLTAGHGAFVSHATAAELWMPTGASPSIHLWSPRRISAAGITSHLGMLDSADVTRLGPIPLTRPERTLIDVASMKSTEKLGGLLDEFLRRDLVRLDRLQRRLDVVRGSGRHGVRLLQRLIEQRRDAGISESELETRFLRALREEGLPLPVCQYEIRHEGRLVARVDFGYPEVKLAIEAYGRRHHSVWSDQEHDLARQNEIIALGWRVIVVTWTRLHTARPALMRTIARALAA